MAVISMLPSGLRDINRTFPDTVIKLKSNMWVEVDGKFQYTEIIDGLSDNDIISYRLYNKSPNEDETYILDNIVNFDYGINHVVFTCNFRPTINVDIELYSISISNRELVRLINELRNIVNAATTEQIPNTLVLRNKKGEIDSEVNKAINATYTANDIYGRGISETYAPIESPSFRGTPTVPNPDLTLEGYKFVIPNIDYVDTKIYSEISKIDFINYIGTIGVDGDITELPREGVRKGDSYKIVTAGDYAEYTNCKVGDILIAKRTGVAERTKDYWSLIPCGDDTPLIRYTTNTSEVNISTTYSSGKLSFGEAATKQVVSSVDDSLDLPTAKAVKSALSDLKQEIMPDGNSMPLIGTISGTDSITIQSYAPGSVSLEHIVPNSNYTDTTINGVTLSVTLNNGDHIFRAKTTENGLKIGEWAKFTDNDEVIRLSDEDQIKLANICLSSTDGTITANGMDIVEMKYPINDVGAYVLNSFNAPQRTMMTLNGEDLYIKTK